MSVLEVRNLKKSFDAHTVVLRGVDFSLEKGETIAIIGSSGSGKTTLLRCLNFLTVPDEGQIVVNGETLFDDVPWRKDVIDEDVKFVDGLMYPSDRPGLGIELNEAAAAAHPKQDHWLRHYAGTLTNIRPPDAVSYYHA